MNGSLAFGDDVDDHMRFADEASAYAKRVIDEYIERAGIDAPPAEDDPAETVASSVPSPPIRSTDLAASGISSIIWCTGFSGDFSWVKIPGVLDEAGQPKHEDGMGTIPGLYFAGLDFAVTRKSGTIPAVAEESDHLVSHIATKVTRPQEEADERAAGLAAGAGQGNEQCNVAAPAVLRGNLLLRAHM